MNSLTDINGSLIPKKLDTCTNWATFYQKRGVYVGKL